MMGAVLESNPPAVGAGESLRGQRNRANLSLAQVARSFRTGVSRQRISRIEKQPRVSRSVIADYRAAVEKENARRRALKALVQKTTKTSKSSAPAAAKAER